MTKLQCEADHLPVAKSRESESQEQHATRNQAARSRIARRTGNIDLELCALVVPNVVTSIINSVCRNCGAQKFNNGTPVICCANGKVKLVV